MRHNLTAINELAHLAAVGLLAQLDWRRAGSAIELRDRDEPGIVWVATDRELGPPETAPPSWAPCEASVEQLRMVDNSIFQNRIHLAARRALHGVPLVDGTIMRAVVTARGLHQQCRWTTDDGELGAVSPADMRHLVYHRWQPILRQLADRNETALALRWAAAT